MIVDVSGTVASTAQRITVETDSCGVTVIRLDGVAIYSTPAPDPPDPAEFYDDALPPLPVPTPVRPMHHQVLDRRDPRLLRHVLTRCAR